ncbi:hypothetical protein M8J77_016629 [Diaphorina citri]|nr:hypothetical protein M8J77_016629 [Diaphorina citri]
MRRSDRSKTESMEKMALDEKGYRLSDLQTTEIVNSENYKDANGRLAMNNEENCDILATYFEQLLNCQEPNEKFPSSTPNIVNEDSQPPS